MPSTRRTWDQALPFLIAFLAFSAIYLYAFPQANVFYAVVVLLHVVAGIVASVLLLMWLMRSWRQGETAVRGGIIFLFLGAIPGLVLIYTGTARSEWSLVYIHLGLSFLGAALFFAARVRWFSRHVIIRVFAALALLAVCAPLARYLRENRWNQHAHIENPTMPPVTMDGEGDGPADPFSQFRAGLRRRKDSQQVLHGVGLLQALPRGHLQPVVQLRPSLFVVQQSVVPQDRSSTCRTRSAPSLRSGAEDATIRPCSTAD